MRQTRSNVVVLQLSQLWGSILHEFHGLKVIHVDWVFYSWYVRGVTDTWVWLNMGMDQYLLIPFLGGWTSIYQLFWCSPGVQGFDTLPYGVIISKVAICWSELDDYHNNLFWGTYVQTNLTNPHIISYNLIGYFATDRFQSQIMDDHLLVDMLANSGGLTLNYILWTWTLLCEQWMWRHWESTWDILSSWNRPQMRDIPGYSTLW